MIGDTKDIRTLAQTGLKIQSSFFFTINDNTFECIDFQYNFKGTSQSSKCTLWQNWFR